MSNLWFLPEATSGKTREATSHGTWPSARFWQIDYIWLSTSISAICGISSVDFSPCFSDQLIPAILIGPLQLLCTCVQLSRPIAACQSDFCGRHYSVSWYSNSTSLTFSWSIHLIKAVWTLNATVPRKVPSLLGYFLSTERDSRTAGEGRQTSFEYSRF